MRTTPMVSLVIKDLMLHGRGIVMTMLCGLALFALVTWLRPSPALMEVSLIFNVNLLTTLLWGDWLISREKTKGTFTWLRTLPLSDRDVVLAKFLTAGGCAGIFWIASSTAFAGRYFVPDHLGVWGVLLLVILTFGAAGVAARWRFGQKVGQTLPLLVVLVPLLVLVLADDAVRPFRDVAAGWWEQPSGKAVVAAGLAVVYVSVVWVTAWWVQESETHRLTE